MLGLAALGLGLGSGWRFGWSPLPEPVPGTGPTAAKLYAPAEVSGSNFWHVLLAHKREAARLPQAAAAGTAPRGGNRGGRFSRGNNFVEPPDLDARFDAVLHEALATPDWRPLATLNTWDRLELRRVVWFGVLPGAERAAGAGDAFTALRRLAEAWQLLAALWNTAELTDFLDERGLGEVHDRLVRPFGALALHGPGLEAGQLRQVRDALEIVRRRADGPDVLYARQLRHARPLMDEVRRPPWAKVSRAAHVAGMLIHRDLVSMVAEVGERLNGSRLRHPPNYHGALHLLRPLGELAAWMQARLARQADFDRLEAASLSRTLEALRRRTLPTEWPPPPWLAGPGDGRTFWQRWLDRPAVWRLPRVLPPPQPVLRLWQEWQWALDACRVMVALRAYREHHGRWPDRLDELVPGWLDAVPPDPFRPDTPLGYTCRGEDWQLEVAAPAQDDPLPGREAHPIPRRLRPGDLSLPQTAGPARN